MVTFVVNEPVVLENTATKKQHSLKSNNVTDLSGNCNFLLIRFDVNSCWAVFPDNFSLTVTASLCCDESFNFRNSNTTEEQPRVWKKRTGN